MDLLKIPRLILLIFFACLLSSCAAHAAAAPVSGYRDGTSILRFRDPESFREVRHILVKDGGHPVDRLNELEYIQGEIYANVWHSDRIARISPRDGHVIAWIDLSGPLPEGERVDAESVLNGIAYDAKGDRLFVTGKEWPFVFQIRVVPRVISRGAKEGAAR